MHMIVCVCSIVILVHVSIWEGKLKLVINIPYKMMKYSFSFIKHYVFSPNIKPILQNCCSWHIQKMGNTQIFLCEVSEN